MEYQTARKYTRIAKLYDLFQWPFEMLYVSSLRSEVIAKAKGEILEVGIGTGESLSLWIMEKMTMPLLGTSMLRETQKRIEKAGFTVLESQNKVLTSFDRLSRPNCSKLKLFYNIKHSY
jgi:ubiquinone/menaquinone biosynthesis C-methylase UbiE